MFTAKELQQYSQLRRVLQMYAEDLPEDQAREVATVYPQYEPGRAYKAGQYITNGTDSNGDPMLYKVNQAHTSQEDWTPESNPALYTCVTMTTGGHPVWAQPTGAHDAYNTGDVVEYKGTLYRSKIDGNVWSPEAYPDGWEAVDD